MQASPKLAQRIDVPKPSPALRKMSDYKKVRLRTFAPLEERETPEGELERSHSAGSV
jgi:hypothetical protein